MFLHKILSYIMMTTKCVSVVALCWSSWPNITSRHKLARPLTEACFGDGDNLGNSSGPRMCLGGGGSKCHKSISLFVL